MAIRPPAIEGRVTSNEGWIKAMAKGRTMEGANLDFLLAGDKDEKQAAYEKAKAKVGLLFTSDGRDLWRAVGVDIALLVGLKNLDTGELKYRPAPLAGLVEVVMPAIPSAKSGDGNNREGHRAPSLRPATGGGTEKDIAKALPPEGHNPFIGVYWEGGRKPWRAQINRKACKWSGHFATAEQARDDGSSQPCPGPRPPCPASRERGIEDLRNITLCLRGEIKWLS